MDKMPLKQLDTPAAKELAETILLQLDINSSISAMQIWTSKNTPNEEQSADDATICESLFRDAIIQFVGCFDKSAKYPLIRDEIYGAANGGDSYFQWLQDIRDAYAAHKFGALRQCIVGVLIDPVTGMIGQGHLSSIYQGPTSPSDGLQIISFMRIGAEFVNKKIKVLQEKMLSEAKQLSPEQLENLPIATAFGIDPTEIRKSRREIQRIRSGKPPKAGR
jgi:hypothetical protein